MTAAEERVNWGRWRGRWIWDHAPEATHWWHRTDSESHYVYLRRTLEVTLVPRHAPARVTCDSRYALHVNGRLLARGPVRSEPELLGWDVVDLAPALVPGRNVFVALCRYYGAAGPWWLPAAPLGTLGRGSFCFETALNSGLDLVSDETWHAVPTPWVPNRWATMHAFPPEVVDGRRAPANLHDPATDDSRWPPAVILSGQLAGTILDRPPAAPYMSPQRRELPQLTSTELSPRRLLDGQPILGSALDEPAAAWHSVRTAVHGDRVVSVWDVGQMTLGHIRVRLTGVPAAAVGTEVDVVAGEDLRPDGLPEIRPRSWAARLVLGAAREQEVTFFDPVGLRYLAAHHAAGLNVSLAVEEAVYPRRDGATFECDDLRYVELWRAAVRTVDLCSTDAFMDCPGREQRAWIADSYVQMLVSYVTNPDWRLIRHQLTLTAQSRHPSGLLAAAAACDFARVGLTTPDYSLHWIRALAAYWRHSGDERFIRDLRPVAEGIIERYEHQRGASGLLEDFPGWVFLDWAQVDRDSITGAHDALYAASLDAYAQLPGAYDVADLVTESCNAFEALWDEERHVYVDAIGTRGRSRRISQHTNAMALLAELVPAHRVEGLIELVADPAGPPLGGRLVTTLTPADVHGTPEEAERILRFQFEAPANFDEERDVVAAQPWFCRFLHEAYARHDRREHILPSLLRWALHPGNGTLQEFWSADAGKSSRCHGWSASPAYDLTTYILGVRPTEPGYSRAVVDPALGPLSRVSGRVPTPLGWLSVLVSGPEIQLEVPEGMLVAVAGREVGVGRHRVVAQR
ncbi:MAG: hypothetical protein H0V23_02510 [Nocardioidaceae bacterium]|nr:hypothetical protein [Nocardioidaceae bacterium]